MVEPHEITLEDIRSRSKVNDIINRFLTNTADEPRVEAISTALDHYANSLLKASVGVELVRGETIEERRHQLVSVLPISYHQASQCMKDCEAALKSTIDEMLEERGEEPQPLSSGRTV